MHALAGRDLAKDVVCLRDGVEALDYLFRRGVFASREIGLPAVIVLDLNMPRIDGMEVLRQVKGDPYLRLIPIVVMSSSREHSDLTQSYQLGANAYVVKPGRYVDFVDTVQQVGVFWTSLNTPPPHRSSVSATS